MAIRLPLYTQFSENGAANIYQADQAYLDEIYAVNGYAYGVDPSVKIEVNTANGTLLANQPFVDTYYIAGEYTTRVDRFSTEAETPNVSMVTDNYSRIRVVYESVTLPTGDANNLQYPVYLYDDGGGKLQLRAMSVTDFVDTFVTPCLAQFGVGGTGSQQSGTYFLTTSATPANAVLVSSTPAAVNSVADVTAYTAGGIAEVRKQTNDVNYYVAKVFYDDENAAFANVVERMPMYFDAGTEQLVAFNPVSWGNLIRPFLRYYLAGGGGDDTYKLSYNIDGADGIAAGPLYVDERVVPTGTGYNQRFVNANDYRTQEFPTGGSVVVSGSQKQFKIYQGPAGGSSTSVDNFPSLPLNGWGTETVEIYQALPGSIAQAFSRITITNQFTANSRIRILGQSGTSLAIAPDNEADINISGYTNPTIEVRYVQTTPSVTGLNSYDESTHPTDADTSSTWYTLSNGGGSKQFDWMAEDQNLGSQAPALVSASSVYFEIRVTESGLPTVTRTSASQAIALEAIVSDSAPQ